MIELVSVAIPKKAKSRSEKFAKRKRSKTVDIMTPINEEAGERVESNAEGIECWLSRNSPHDNYLAHRFARL
jgi:hypothetical protein